MRKVQWEASFLTLMSISRFLLLVWPTVLVWAGRVNSIFNLNNIFLNFLTRDKYEMTKTFPRPFCAARLILLKLNVAVGFFKLEFALC